MREGIIIPFPNNPDTRITHESSPMDTPTPLIHAAIESLTSRLPLTVNTSHVTELFSTDMDTHQRYQHAGTICFFDATRSGVDGIKTFRVCIQDCTQRPQREGGVDLSPAELLSLPTVRVSVRTTIDTAQYGRWFHIENETEYDELLGSLYGEGLQT